MTASATSRPAMAAGPAGPIGSRSLEPATLTPLAPRTLVDRVAEAIVRAAALGEILPGDRVIEADLARQLGVSRVPVREALRTLESQGVVVNTPYRGMRLMEVTAANLRDLLRVRLELERFALRELLSRRTSRAPLLAALDGLCGAMAEAAARRDSYGLARLDTEFHRELCRASGNATVARLFEPLGTQLTIIFGLSALQEDPRSIVEGHRRLRDLLAAGRRAELMAFMKVHILDDAAALDHEGFVRSRRRAG